ncbi:hypothetical protein ATE92_1991 [Ulvibacter sp. MAR_2010_11]|uniref:hypothetical protein n=1 Tax=Ulvibacter sp. MAR_2010_11 TaxID=1250229 RepID=UPI000C2C5113|nr:hypothetical protein [Ulvibacter sp. MAR_2010_11]PKA83823.1 hypothetical protein ATE92_1991 [Ulvibacter sp. MAR_2010_11]
MENAAHDSKKWRTIFLLYMIFSSLVLIGLVISVYQLSNQKIIRAEGIVIHDSDNTDRILIGAPIPFSYDRVRTDTSKVRKYWGVKYGEEYMKAYNNYHHGTNGIIVLNKEGFDKVVLGENLTDPNTGKRIAEITGMVWNDDLGYERGGAGLNKLFENQKYRTGFGLDDEGGEGLHSVILEDGSKFIRIAYNEGYLLIGRANANNPFFQNKEEFVGIMVRDTKDSLIYKTNFLSPQ